VDEKGNKVKHYGGPSWEAADGSKVVARAAARRRRQQARYHQLAPAQGQGSRGRPQGALGKVEYIQRIETSGGRAPAKPDASYAGTELHVPYKATYVFYGPKS